MCTQGPWSLSATKKWDEVRRSQDCRIKAGSTSACRPDADINYVLKCSDILQNIAFIIEVFIAHEQTEEKSDLARRLHFRLTFKPNCLKPSCFQGAVLQKAKEGSSKNKCFFLNRAS